MCAVWRDHCAALDKSRAAAEVNQQGRGGRGRWPRRGGGRRLCRVAFHFLCNLPKQNTSILKKNTKFLRNAKFKYKIPFS